MYFERRACEYPGKPMHFKRAVTAGGTRSETVAMVGRCRFRIVKGSWVSCSSGADCRAPMSTSPFLLEVRGLCSRQ